MIKRLILCNAAGLAAFLMLRSLLWIAHLPGYQAAKAAKAGTIAAPGIIDVNPSQGLNNLDTSIAIHGTDFAALISGTQVITPPMVYLGDAFLDANTWISSTLITATVPWGLPPDVYTLTVVNPGGESTILPEAFTVTQAIGVWTSAGPYGGDVEDLAVSPLVSTTAFASVYDAGLFRTLDGGANWSQLMFQSGTGSFAYGSAPTYPLYYHTEVNGLFRSDDQGDTWKNLSTENMFAFAMDPQDEGHMWMSNTDGVQLSTDGGLTWELRSTGLPVGQDYIPQRIAVHPQNHGIVFVGLGDGRLYRTVDEGLHWSLLENGLPVASWGYAAYGLAIDPLSPDVVLYSRWQDRDAFGYRSADGGDTWTPVIAPQGCGLLYDPIFSPHTSGVVYTPVDENMFAESADHGITWTCQGERLGDFMISLGLDPVLGVPAYLGGHSAGIWHSLDGGQTWQHATRGITGLPIMDVASSPSNPEVVYMAAEHAGAFGSGDAGHAWKELGVPAPGVFCIGVDPYQSDMIYAAADWGVYRSLNGGVDWLFSPVPSAQQTFLDVIEVSVSSPSVIYTGGRNDEISNAYNGLAFHSQDSGVSWNAVNFGGTIGNVTDIDIDPWDSQRVYVVAGEAWPLSVPSAPDVLRTTDGGASWQSIRQGLGSDRYAALAIHPLSPNILYIGAYSQSIGHWTVFKSLDYGDTWQPTDLPLTWSLIKDLAIDPLDPDRIYAGTREGLYFTEDGGENWSKVPGALGATPVEKLSIASSTGRTILYIGTTGGVTTGGTQSSRPTAFAPGDSIIQGGIYQFTIDHRSLTPRLFIPIIFR